jgi:hypothetical protein
LEVDVEQGNFKILHLLLQVLILFLVEKWIPPSRPETAKIGQKKRWLNIDLLAAITMSSNISLENNVTEGILGVKYDKKIYNYVHLFETKNYILILLMTISYIL